MSATTQTALERNHQTGLSDSTTSTSSSAERYRLDEDDARPILIYKYRGGLQTSSQKELCAWLDKDEKLRCTKKFIPRGTSYVDVRRHDLYLPDEKHQFASLPNFDSSLASIKVPFLAYLSRLVFGNYEELYIVSPETSPNMSQTDGDSRRSSPITSTWGQNSQEDAREGAGADEENNL
jgi:hypothetical protein